MAHLTPKDVVYTIRLAYDGPNYSSIVGSSCRTAERCCEFRIRWCAQQLENGGRDVGDTVRVTINRRSGAIGCANHLAGLDAAAAKYDGCHRREVVSTGLTVDGWRSSEVSHPNQ